jgi:hypothetical protein
MQEIQANIMPKSLTINPHPVIFSSLEGQLARLSTRSGTIQRNGELSNNLNKGRFIEARLS